MSMKTNKEHWYNRIKPIYRILAGAAVVIGMVVGVVCLAAKYTEAAADYSKKYALVVSTGAINGNTIGMFAVHYIDTNNNEQTQYIMAHDSTLGKGYQNSGYFGYNSATEDLLTKCLSYDLDNYQSNNYSNITALQSHSKDTYLLDFYHEIKSVTRIDIITDLGEEESSRKAEWTCEGIGLYKVNNNKGIYMNGGISNSYYIFFEGTPLAETVFKEGTSSVIVSNANFGSQDIVYSIEAGDSDKCPADSEVILNTKFSKNDTYKTTVKTVYVELDIADVYQAGIEALTNFKDGANDTEKMLNAWYLPEVLTLTLRYVDQDSHTRTVTVPVLMSALVTALKNKDSGLSANSQLLDVLGQGESLLLELPLEDFDHLVATNDYNCELKYVNSADEICKMTGLKDQSASHSARELIRKRIREIPDDGKKSDIFRPSGIHIYYASSEDADKEAEELENLKKAVSISFCKDEDYPNSILVGKINNVITEAKTGKSVKVNPKYSIHTSDIKGRELDSTNATGSNASVWQCKLLAYVDGKALRATSQEEKYLLEICTSNADLAETTSDIDITLYYTNKKNYKESCTESISLKKASRDFYGYWPDENSVVKKCSDGTELLDYPDYSYLAGVSKSNVLYAIVSISEVRNFTAVEFELKGADDWQMQNFTIYQIGTKTLEPRIGLWNNYKEYSMDRYFGRSLYGLEVLFNSKDVEMYLDKTTPKKRIEFKSADTASEIEREIDQWRDSDDASHMSYETFIRDLGYTTAKAYYEVSVHVASTSFASGNGDCGSNNYFYFQLVFEKGTSAYVQANQQLPSDGFYEGKTPTFRIATNHDMGELTAVNVLPDQSSSTADPYDKLNIEWIKVKHTNTRSIVDEWTINTDSSNCWVGIDYIEEGADQSEVTKDQNNSEDALTTYLVNEKSTQNQLLVTLNTGYPTSTSAMDNDQQFTGRMYATIYYTNLEGKSVQSDKIDVVKAIYEFTGEAVEMESIVDAQGTTASGTIEKVVSSSTMFRKGSADRFKISLSNVRSIDKIEFTLDSSINCAWKCESVAIAMITEDNGRKIDVSTNQYILDGTFQEITTTVEGESANDHVIFYHPGQQNGTLKMNFEKNEIYLDDSNKTSYTISREPVSRNDYLNIVVYPTDGTRDFSKYKMKVNCIYTTAFGLIYHTGETLKQGSLNGETVFYINGLGVSNISALSAVNLRATGSTSNLELLNISHAIVQRVRSGVVIDTIRFDYGDGNALDGVDSSASSTDKDQADSYQVVTIQLGENTTQVDSDHPLIDQKRDIAVCITYTTTNGMSDKEYSSAYRFLSDEEIQQVGPNRLIRFLFKEKYIKDITGVTIASTRQDLVLDVQQICVGMYVMENGYAASENVMTDTKANYKCAKWYGCDEAAVLMANSHHFGVESTENNPDADVLVPMSITFDTKASDATRADYGTDGNIYMRINYISKDGNPDAIEILDARQYLTSGSFETGQSATIEFMALNIMKITSITVRCYDYEDASSLSWGLDKIHVCYGDGVNISDRTIPVDKIVEEEQKELKLDESGKPYYIISHDGLIIPLQSDVLSIDAATSDSEEYYAAGSDIENSPIIDIKNSGVRVTFKPTLSDGKTGLVKSGNLEVSATVNEKGDRNEYLTNDGTYYYLDPPENTSDQEELYKIEFSVVMDDGQKLSVTIYVRVMPVEKPTEEETTTTPAEETSDSTSEENASEETSESTSEENVSEETSESASESTSEENVSEETSESASE